MGLFKNLFWDFIYRNDNVNYARKLGVEVGNDCKILCNPRKWFGTEPWLIKIGSHVEITGNVTLLTHDGSTWIIREKFPELAIWGTIEIGNNVFIGNSSIIMPNVKIGNNCVIGAGSIVTKDVPDNCIVAGVPAKIINDFDSFTDKIVNKAIPVLSISTEERKQYTREFIKEYNNSKK